MRHFRVNSINTKKWVASFSKVAYFTLLLAIPIDSVGRPSITSTLNEGSIWMLNVNGEQNEMVIGAGKGKQRGDGSLIRKASITWKGRKGGLLATVTADEISQNINLFVTTAKGKKIKCKGSAAYGANNMMAGTCGEENSQGAWYAVLKENKTKDKPHRKSVRTEKRRPIQDKGTNEQSLKQAELERDKIKRQLSIERNNLKKCRASLSSCMNTTAKGASTRELDSFKNNVTGAFSVPVRGGTDTGGAADNVQTSSLRVLQPTTRGDQDLIHWLNILKGWSASVVHNILSSDDHHEFTKLEDDRCNGDIFCEIALEQQTIACALGAAGC